MIGEYTEDELARLHGVLYDILAEICRVCDSLHIPYFIQGGTAIGAHFEQAILPWDDDIDIGMTRENFTRFLREAPAHLRPGYFLQWLGTDPHTPYYFAKVMKEGTTFVEADFAHLDIHRGIFIDVFPFDKVPDNQPLQKLHRLACNYLNCCFMAKDIWLWKHVRRCEVQTPSNRGFLPCLATAVTCALLSKRTIYRALSWLQGIYNGGRHTYYNMVLMPRDHISVESIEHPQYIPFGPMKVWAPSDLDTYLHHHYRNLRRHIPKEEQRNHRPTYLEF